MSARHTEDRATTVRRVIALYERDTVGDVPRLTRKPGTLTSWRYDASASGSGSFACENPVSIELIGRKFTTVNRATFSEVDSTRNAPTFLDVEGRCRRCSECLKYRRYVWATRARDEIARSQRTWFGTLTLRPDRQFHYLNVERIRASARGQDFYTQDGDKKFARLVHASGKAVTLMLKRLRKKTGAHIRYLMVAERHANGNPHFHILVHEPDAFNVVRKSELEAEWHEGFSMWRVVQDSNAANYVTKYLAKELTTRVRASLHYGQPQDAGMCVSAQDPPRDSKTKSQRENKRPPNNSVQGLD